MYHTRKKLLNCSIAKLLYKQHEVLINDCEWRLDLLEHKLQYLGQLSVAHGLYVPWQTDLPYAAQLLILSMQTGCTVTAGANNAKKTKLF
jgi:hypothetical protein